MEITEVKNIGRVVKGTVFDCNRKFLDKRLRDIDPRLYTSWNPYKNGGRGIWEIRILPSKKSEIYYGEYEGSPIFRLEYREDSMVHHIMDVPCLHENILNRLREMDTTKVITSMSTFSDWLEYEEDRVNEKADKALKEELMLRLKEERKYMEILYEEARSGRNPADFFRGDYGKIR